MFNKGISVVIELITVSFYCCSFLFENSSTAAATDVSFHFYINVVIKIFPKVIKVLKVYF